MTTSLPSPARRVFLQKGLLGGLLLALGGAGWLASRGSAPAPTPPGLLVLTAAEYAVVAALVRRFAPERAGWATPDALGTATAVDGIIALLEPGTQHEIQQLLMLFENALPNFLFGLRTAPFTQLAPDAQEQVLAEWRESRLTLRRTGYRALRGLCLAAYYGNPKVWPQVGYPGPPQGIHDPDAPVWKGGGQPRPFSNGTWLEVPADPPTEPVEAPVAPGSTP